MGRSYLFQCCKCGYQALVSGGPDRGLDFIVQTIACRDCKELYDAVVRLKEVKEAGRKLWPEFRLQSSTRRRDAPPRFESVLNRLPFPVSKSLAWTQFKIRCPKSGVHRVQIWNDPGKCPRCGADLEKNALPFRIWD